VENTRKEFALQEVELKLEKNSRIHFLVDYIILPVAKIEGEKNELKAEPSLLKGNKFW